jgi:hypothetical protein
MTRVLSMHSGGLLSWASGRRAVARYGRENVELLFADTMMEDADLYRFLVEGAANILGATVPEWLTELASMVPDVEDDPDGKRKVFLPALAEAAQQHIPGFHWIMDGRTPFEVFTDERFIGNTRVDPCSKILKRRLMDRWRDEHFSNWGTLLAFGLDWSERGRIEGERGKPGHRQRMADQGWRAIYPMDEKPYLTEEEVKAELRAEGIRVPRLYDLGFPHNNCGGYCCKMGLAQAARLLETMPERYEWFEERERRAMETIGPTASPSLRFRSKGRVRPVTLKQFRLIQERQPRLFEGYGWGCGGGCAIDDEPASEGVLV